MDSKTQSLLEDASRRSLHYLKTIEERRVFPSPEDLANLAKWDAPLPANPTDPSEVLAFLDDVGSPATVATAGPRYFGFVTGGALPITVAANWLACAWDQCAGLEALSPAASAIEAVALQWLVELFGLPPGTAGGFVTGATTANFTALAAARHAVLAQAGWDVEAKGLFGAPPITVIVGEEVHVSALKALAMLGLGRERVVQAKADAQGRMRADALPKIAGPGHRLSSGWQREFGSFRSRDGNLPCCAHCRCMGPRGRRIRSVGCCGSLSRSPFARSR